MRISLVGLLIVLMMMSAFAQETILSKEQEQAALNLRALVFPKGPINHNQVRAVAAPDRELLIAYLRGIVTKRKSEGETDASMGGWEIVSEMALLGDDWARNTVVLDFWKQPRANPVGLRILQDPKVIPMIGEGLFMEEVFEMRGDVGYSPTQEVIAQVIVYTLAHSPDFNEAVKAWGNQIWYPRRYTVEVIREWYRANEAALKAGDFQAVQPGAELAQNLRGQPTAVQQSTTVAPSPGTVSPSAAATPAPLSVINPQRKAPIWLWITGLGGIIALIVFLFKRHA